MQHIMKFPFKLRTNIQSSGSSLRPTPAPYNRTSAHELVDGNRMDASTWLLDGYLVMLNTYPCHRRIIFKHDVPQKLGFSSDDRELLILVEKEFLRWLRIDRRYPWEQINTGVRNHFKALVRFMAMRGISRLSDITPGAFGEFLVYPRTLSRGYTAKRRLFVRQLHEEFFHGTLPDGPLFHPADFEPPALKKSDLNDEVSDDAEEAQSSEETAELAAPDTRTMPLTEDMFLRILEGSLNFIRANKCDLLKAVREFAETGDADMGFFEGFPCLKGVQKYKLDRVLVEFQRACYVVISATLIGRSNEYFEIGRFDKCYVPTDVQGEISHGVMIPWSKRHDQKRYLVRGRGTPFTVEAIKALDELVAAHPATRNSQYLFCRFSQHNRSAPAGALLGPYSMGRGIPIFLRRTIGLSRDEAAEVHPHRFRSTAIVNLCCVTNGVIAAWFETRHASLKQLCDYALAATNWLGIEDNLDELAA
jgi:hypothetical protein